MQALWQIEHGTVNDIIEQLPDPKPKYTTAATFIKILENKGFVGHEPAGKGFRYFPIVAKADYAGDIMHDVLASYFNGSLSQLVSFFSQKENLSLSEMQEILDIAEQIKKNR